MKKIKDVSAGLDLIAERKKDNAELSKFLDMLDQIEAAVGGDRPGKAEAPIQRPYSGQELVTTERWK
jgi:hypothetical protein